MVNHPTSSSSGALAHVGDTLDLQTPSGKHFQITLMQVVDPARSTGQSSSKSKSGKSKEKFVATVFRVTNTSSQELSADGTSDANLVGSDGQTYLPDHESLTECTGNPAKYQFLAAGKSVTSCVPYQVRTSVKIAKVQFFPGAGSGKDYGEWLVP